MNSQIKTCKDCSKPCKTFTRCYGCFAKNKIEKDTTKDIKYKLKLLKIAEDCIRAGGDCCVMLCDTHDKQHFETPKFNNGLPKVDYEITDDEAEDIILRNN